MSAHASGSCLFLPPIHPRRRVWPDRGRVAAAATPAVPAGCRGGPVRWRGVSFFICQSQLDQNVVDGRKRAGQPGGGAQFLQGQVGLAGQQCPHLLAVAGHDTGLATRTMVLGAKIANPAALLEEEWPDESQQAAARAQAREAATPVPGAFVGSSCTFFSMPSPHTHRSVLQPARSCVS